MRGGGVTLGRLLEGVGAVVEVEGGGVVGGEAPRFLSASRVPGVGMCAPTTVPLRSLVGVGVAGVSGGAWAELSVEWGWVREDVASPP